MPLMKMQLSVVVPPEKKKALLAECSRILAEVTGKPERYVMITLETAEFLMAGAPGPAAFVDIRGIGGLTKSVNARLSQAVGDLLQREFSIDPARVYLNFFDVAAQNWGHNDKTFG